MFVPLILFITILFLWDNNRTSTYFNQNKLKASIIKIIENKSNLNNIDIKEMRFVDSKIALYYSYGNKQNQYATGLFEERLLPPYVKMIVLGYGNIRSTHDVEPTTVTMSKNINILFFYNKNKEVAKIKLGFSGEPVNKMNEYVDISNSDIYFGVIEMKKQGTVCIENYYDKNNKIIFPL